MAMFEYLFDGDGTVQGVHVTEEWPTTLEVTDDLLRASMVGASPFLKWAEVGQSVDIDVDNGFANYKLVDYDYTKRLYTLEFKLGWCDIGEESPVR